MGASNAARVAAEQEVNEAFEGRNFLMPEVGDPDFWTKTATAAKRLAEAYEALLKFEHPTWAVDALIDAKFASRHDYDHAVGQAERRASREAAAVSGEVSL